MNEIKIVITGTVGSGKTEGIKTLSGIDVISTDVKASDKVKKLKETTTIAMDYGEISLDSGEVLAIYGTPGQERFSYMWKILAEGALGFIIMVDDSRSNPLDDLCIYLDNFSAFIEDTTVVIGVTHTDGTRISSMDKYYRFLKKNHIYYPVMAVDARDKAQMENLMLALVSMLEVC